MCKNIDMNKTPGQKLEGSLWQMDWRKQDWRQGDRTS